MSDTFYSSLVVILIRVVKSNLNTTVRGKSTNTYKQDLADLWMTCGYKQDATKQKSKICSSLQLKRLLRLEFHHQLNKGSMVYIILL